MKKYYLHPYCIDGPVQRLSEAFGTFRIKTKDSKFIPGNNDVVINWGSYHGKNYPYPIINRNSYIASNKLRALKQFNDHNVPTVEWTTNRNEAASWIEKGYTVLARVKNSMGGKHTIVCTTEIDIQDTHDWADFWTKVEPIVQEFRVHVMNDKAFWFQQKQKKQPHENADPIIRSHGRGWCFAIQNMYTPRIGWEALGELGVQAVKACHLDFGAVDIGIIDKNNALVFEVNTAPGIENTTLTKYVEAFHENY